MCRRQQGPGSPETTTQNSLNLHTRVGARSAGTPAFTKEGQPEKFQVSRIEALPDDPDRGVWSLLSATGIEPRDLPWSPPFDNTIKASGITLPPGFIDSITKDSGPATDPVPHDEEDPEEGPEGSDS